MNFNKIFRKQSHEFFRYHIDFAHLWFIFILHKLKLVKLETDISEAGDEVKQAFDRAAGSDVRMGETEDGGH